MKCTAIPGGFICGTRTRRKCSSCGGDRADKQCDYPVTRRVQQAIGHSNATAPTYAGTCDRYLCSTCAVMVAPDIDYCPAHHRASQETKTP